MYLKCYFNQYLKGIKNGLNQYFKPILKAIKI